MKSYHSEDFKTDVLPSLETSLNCPNSFILIHAFSLTHSFTDRKHSHSSIRGERPLLLIHSRTENTLTHSCPHSFTGRKKLSLIHSRVEDEHSHSFIHWQRSLSLIYSRTETTLIHSRTETTLIHSRTETTLIHSRTETTLTFIHWQRPLLEIGHHGHIIWRYNINRYWIISLWVSWIMQIQYILRGWVNRN